MSITAKFDGHPQGLVELECESAEEFSAIVGNGVAVKAPKKRAAKKKSATRRGAKKKKAPTSRSKMGRAASGAWAKAREYAKANNMGVREARAALAKQKPR